MSKYTTLYLIALVFILLVSACAPAPAAPAATATAAPLETEAPAVTTQPSEPVAPVETTEPVVTTEVAQPSETVPAKTPVASVIVVTPATPAATQALPDTGAICPLTDEEYAVYSALMKDKFLKDSNVTQIVLRNATVEMMPGDVPPIQEDFLRAQKPDQASDLLADLNMKAAQPCPLEQRFAEDIPVRLVSEAEVQQFFQGQLDKAWTNFYTQNPGAQGLMELSRVGFSKDGNVAAVYLGNQQGGLAGGGYNYLLEKTSSGWTVVAEIMTWIS